MLKILDRLDRYHGFGKLTAAKIEADEGGARAAARQAQCDGGAHDRGAKGEAMSARPAAKRKPRGRGWRSGAATGANLLRNIGVLLELSPAERARLLAGLSDKQCDELFYDWSLWARADQRPPPGDWIYWLILAGRGAGKTRAGAEAVREWVKDFAIVNLVGATHDDVRDVMVLGDSGLMAICPPGERPHYARASGRLTPGPTAQSRCCFRRKNQIALRALATRARSHDRRVIAPPH